MVEGGPQLDVLGQQHAVAEHVPAHVADADDGEGFSLGIDAQLSEMPFNRLPRTLGGDPHLFVVITDRSARGIRIGHPESVFLADRISDVGKRGRSLIGGNDQIGIVTVMPNHAFWRYQFTGNDVVGDVQQTALHGFVAFDPFGQERFPPAFGRRLLNHETAL